MAEPGQTISSTAGQPVMGVDPTGIARHLKVDSSGDLQVTATSGSTQDVNLLQVAGTAVTAGAGAVTAGTQRTTLASDDPAVSALGATTGTKVVTDANGTIQQYLRGIVTFLANALGAGTAAAANRVTLASDDPAVATLGATTGAAVITDANGTLQQYLRGLVKLAITAGGFGTKEIRASTSAQTNPSYTTLNNSSQTLLAASSSTLGVAIYNNTNALLYVLCGGAGTASATFFTVIMQPSAYYEVPFNCTAGIFGFQVSGAATSGNVNVTQFTA